LGPKVTTVFGGVAPQSDHGLRPKVTMDNFPCPQPKQLGLCAGWLDAPSGPVAPQSDYVFCLAFAQFFVRKGAW
jgi:hypothetical protein